MQESCETNSTNHKNNKKNLSSDDNLSKKNRKLPVFQEKWLDVEELKCWLRKEPRNVSKFFCLICNKSFMYSGRQIYSHANSKAHIKRCKRNSIEISKSNEDLKFQVNKSLLTLEERRKEAEIRYAALLTDQNISYRHSRKILNLFQYVGEGPNVLKKMRTSRTKCVKIITNVLYPNEMKRLVNKIQNTKFTVFIGFTSDIYKGNIWMIFQVRYVDSETLDVRSQIVELMSIDAKDFSANKLFERLKNKMLELNIPFSNIVALLCNNTSIMTENHSLFKKEFKKLCPHLMTLLCSCHSATLVAHNACDKIPTFCEKFIKNIFSYINDRPRHFSEFMEFCKYFQETSHKILEYDTYWISRYNFVEKFLEYWDMVKNFLETKSTRAASNLLFTMCMVETKAYFLFLKYVLSFFNAFNTFFQTLETQIHLLQSKSLILLQEICQNFLQSEHLTPLLTDVDFSLKKNQKILNKIFLGSKCEEYLNELMTQGHENVVMVVRQNCLMFYVTAAEEICERLPVKNIFLSKLQVFKNLFETDIETSFNDVSFIAETIGDFDEDALKKEWISLSLEFTIEEKRRLSLLSFDNMWKEILQCRHPNNIAKYPLLTNVLNAIRSFPNSNVDIERTFALFNSVLRKRSILPTLINAICVFKSALNARGETSLNMTIEKEHVSLMTTNDLYGPPNTGKKCIRKSKEVQDKIK
ncbi:hypothetical protein ALC60_01891 [Trachymyrmex zeteki]|uniref:HAT C-terminal dimerisation domain-containing protein n=1 Tax=Mycetomoellerius zeteki TaxID=64791 RepID=A0A151XF91_9HYME|nr:hypothetical protein ALC60_01891 [Trachymyrmex zeteki]